MTYAARIAKLERTNGPNADCLSAAEIDAAVARFAADLEHTGDACRDARPVAEIVDCYRAMISTAKGWTARIYANCSFQDFRL